MLVYWDDPFHPVKNLCGLELFPFFQESRYVPKSSSTFIETFPPQKKITIKERRFSPDKKDWKKQVEKALFSIRQGRIEKVVLARETLLIAEERVDPHLIISFLKKNRQNSSLFCLSFEETSFLGATPETLFSRSYDDIQTVSMAGTRRRGNTQEEDLFLENELLRSGKDLKELLPVRRHMDKNLSPLLQNSLIHSPISIFKTPNVQHLYSTSIGKRKPNITDTDLVKALHPTPALAGSPVEAALSLIKEMEPFDRGLYGAALGWSERGASHWIVAIRSCKVEANTIRLYSAAGIVEGSDPDREWEELDEKIKLYEGLFR